MAEQANNKPRSLNPPTIPTPPPTYSQLSITPLVPTSRLITLAGQTGVSPTTQTIVPGGFELQVRQTYANISQALKAVGATPRDIIHVRHYIVQGTGRVGVKSQGELTRVWGRLWVDFMDEEGEGWRPPDTVLGVGCLAVEGLEYECEVWAVVQG